MTAAGLGSGSLGSGATLSIGSVLDALRADFPEITISKIRFLESEGLIHPARTPAGYRQFSHADVARLRFVLGAQRDHYLPLKVIRAKLEEFDDDPGAGLPHLDAPGLETRASLTTTAPPSGAGTGPTGTVGPVRSRLAAVGEPTSETGGPGGPGGPPRGGPPRGGDEPALDGRPSGTVDRATLLGEDGVDAALLEGLEHHGILRPDASGRYAAEAPAVVRTAAALARLGVEPRLLRSARASADREVGLLTQLVTPVARSRGPEASRRAEDLSGELAALSGRLHALLVGAGLRGELKS